MYSLERVDDGSVHSVRFPDDNDDSTHDAQDIALQWARRQTLAFWREEQGQVDVLALGKVIRLKVNLDLEAETAPAIRT